MCSVIILYRPGHDWPLLWASNRDEMADRPWSPPARHWPDRPDVVAGRDELAGGTWLGVNDAGVVAGVLNRRNTLGPQPGKRSRGELVLDALDFPDASDAIDMLVQLDAHAFRPFNMVVADNRDAFWLRNMGQKVEAEKLPPRPVDGDGLRPERSEFPPHQLVPAALGGSGRAGPGPGRLACLGGLVVRPQP